MQTAMSMPDSIISEYLSKVPEPERSVLERIREIVRNTVPEAVEVISYGMPGFKYKGKYMLGFAAFKKHMSFFPTSGPIEKLQDKLKNFKLAKGTIQFSMDNPLPESLINEIAQIRMDEIDKK